MKLLLQSTCRIGELQNRQKMCIHTPWRGVKPPFHIVVESRDGSCAMGTHDDGAYGITGADDSSPMRHAMVIAKFNILNCFDHDMRVECKQKQNGKSKSHDLTY